MTRRTEDDEPVSTEETPLLDTAPQEDPRDLYRQNVLILTFCMLVLLELGAGIMTPPLNAIMEDVICRSYNPQLGAADGHHLTQDPICKNPDVQGKLAMLRGWAITVECIPGLLLTVPYGILSDKWGRQPVLFLSLFGICLSILFNIIVLALPSVFPIELTLLAPIFEVIGGGSFVAQAMLYTYVADVVPISDRATVYLRLTAMFQAGEVIATPLAGLIMMKDPWLAMITGFVLLVVSALVTLVMPETLELRRQADAKRAQEAAALRAANGEVEANEHDDGIDCAAEEEADLSVWRKTWHSARQNAVEVWDFIIGNKRIAVLGMSLAFAYLGRYVQELLLQYATKRYGISWSNATFLLTTKSISWLVGLTITVPAASWVCLHYFRLPALIKDIYLTRISGFILIFAMLWIAFAWNLWLLVAGLIFMSFGAGYTSLIRSLLNSLVEAHHVGTLNSLISLMETVGLMVAGPVLSQTFKIGIYWGGPWIGLPFMFAAGLFAIATAISVAFRMPATLPS